MRKMQAPATAFAVLLALSAPAFAAGSSTTTLSTTTGATEHGPATAPNNEETLNANQMRASQVIGADAYDVQNQQIGTVKDLIIDNKGRVDAVIVDLGDKKVAVKPAEIKTANNRLTIDMSKKALEQMTAYTLTNPQTGAGTTESPVHGGTMGSGSSTHPVK